MVVIFDHAGLGLFKSGFLGVDIFFVISGFLITGIIARDLRRGLGWREFFGGFYFKRARRILPAAFATILLTTVGSIWFLSSLEMVSLRDQVLGALTYTINFVLAEQVDYFAVDANLKPLLHMWSLAVEEQFYIVIPVLMFLIPARAWRPAILIITIASFIFCLWLVRENQPIAFYMLPSRAWELGIGACAALFADKIAGKAVMRMLFWPAVAVVLCAPLVQFEFMHPGWPAGLLCIATAVVILADKKEVAELLPVRLAGRVGDMSYSLYLAHWPVMVFAYSAYLGNPPTYAVAVTLVIAIGLGVALYYLIEDPFRRRHQVPTLRFVASIPLVTFMVAAAYFGSAAYARPTVDFEEMRAPNFGFGRICDYSGDKFIPHKECRNAEKPNVLYWGDSYAMHLVLGAAEDEKITQTTFSACAPFVGYAPKRKMANADVWANLCLDFNNRVLNWLKTQDTIHTVALSASWRLWVEPGSVLLSQGEDGFDENASGLEFAINAIGKTIEPIKAMGFNVVMFAPPPSTDIDTSECLERASTGKVIFGAGCAVDRAAAMHHARQTYKFLDAAAAKYGVKVIRIADALCDGDTCITEEKGKPIYRDGGHLSHDGSKIVFRLFRKKDLLGALDN